MLDTFFKRKSSIIWMRRRELLVSSKENNPSFGGYEYVDLGLPSGLLWASWNVGASGETDYGNYYQYGKGARTYQQTSGETDYSGTEIPLAWSADTASQVMGGSWRLPTRDECQELIDNCTCTWTIQDGVGGKRFTSRKSGYTDNSIFIPVAGRYNGSSLYDDGSRGYYWTSSQYSSSRAWYLSLNSSTQNTGNDSRVFGLSVRGVMSYVMDTNVLFYNETSSQYKVFKISEFPSNDLGWTPIAIEVVPPSHNRYKDGSGGYMSLGGIRANGVIQTDGKDDSSYMNWGPDGDAASLTDYKNLDESNRNGGYVHWQTDSGSTSCSFYTSTSANNVQYPYTTLNGTVVKSYSAGSLSDYDGIGNTNKISGSTYRAAYACRQVSTVGTSKGDWYLPACGELAYLPSIRFEVNKTIASLRSIYGSVGSLLNINHYWSSTESDYYYAWCANSSQGLVGRIDKGSNCIVRPFLRFNPSTNQIVTE